MLPRKSCIIDLESAGILVHHHFEDHLAIVLYIFHFYFCFLIFDFDEVDGAALKMQILLEGS